MNRLKFITFNFNLHRRIYGSFLLLVILFVVNGVVIITTITNIRNSANRLSRVVDPSVLVLREFEKLILESKMYTTNWVYLRANQQDKGSLVRIHNEDYPVLKTRLEDLSSQWIHKPWQDSMQHTFGDFSTLLKKEKEIMALLSSFSDYDDPVNRLEAERMIEEEILPRTTEILRQVKAIHDFGVSVRDASTAKVNETSGNLRLFIVLLAILIICISIVLSRYMSLSIIGPVNKIRAIVNDLGKGIIRKLPQPGYEDEIGEMIRSVNQLSAKISVTTAFAHEIGNRNFSTWYEPLSDEDSLGHALIMMRDNLRKGEAALELKTRELERKNKELEQFVYIASHDLQEPLRTTTSFVELLQQQYKGQLDPKADKYLSFIVQSSDRMKILINDLLDYSRIGNKKELELVDCNLLMEEVLNDLAKKIEDVDAEINVSSLPVVNGYRTELHQLLLNLTVNAIKFRKKDTRPVLHLSARRFQGDVVFRYRDNGIGIPAEHRERIFVIFQRLHTRTEYEGSGIGLAHCKKIVGLHGGKIWVESEPGEGSSFYFSIPEIKPSENETKVELCVADR